MALLRWLKWLLILVVAAALLVLLLNLRDEPLTAEAQAWLKPPVAIPPQANAYFDVLGMAGSAADANAEGQRLWAEMQQGKSVEPTASGSRARRCADKPEVYACMQSLAPERGSLLAENAALVAQYRTLLSRRQFQTPDAAKAEPPLPPWQAPLQAQELYLLELGAEAGGAAQAVQALASDAAYWRGLLAGSDLLITKMIAIAALRHDLLYAAGWLRSGQLPPAAAQGLSDLLAPYTPAELAVLPVLQGEFRWRSRVWPQLREACAAGKTCTEEQLNESRMLRLLVKPQATINLDQRRSAALAAQLDAGCERLGAPEPDPPVWTELRPYNPVGRLLLGIGGATLDHGYKHRLCDLEGLRRLVALQARVLAEGVSAAAVPGWLLSTGIEALDPYTGKPMTWDAAAKTLRFDARDTRTQADLPWPLQTAASL